MRDLKTALASGRVLLADGAIGTELQRRGLLPGECGEAWNLTRPEVVTELHRAYVAAGCELLTTNSFGASRLLLEPHGEAARTVAINEEAARLAKAAAGERCFVLGDIGPFGGFLPPLGCVAPGDVFDAFREQAAALLAGGADAILIETMQAVEEIELAVRAARAAGSPLVLASFAFARTRHGSYRTMMGVSPAQAASAMTAAGADVIGANCGHDLESRDFAAILVQMRGATQRPLLVQPNAGQPQLTDTGAVAYPMDPPAFATMLAELAAAGATVVGGCCGTTPAHVAGYVGPCPREA